MPLDPLNIPLGVFSLEAAEMIADAIADASGSGIVSAPSIELTSTVGGITFTSAGTINFNLPSGVWSLISSKSVNFDTTNGDPDSSSRINFLSGESIVFQATQDSTGKIGLNSTHVNLPSLQVFANNAAAISGGLNVGDLYRTGADPDPVCVVH
jgi:hypothetical protein